jgi:hypothetical protein
MSIEQERRNRPTYI